MGLASLTLTRRFGKPARQQPALSPRRRVPLLSRAYPRVKPTVKSRKWTSGALSFFSCLDRRKLVTKRPTKRLPWSIDGRKDPAFSCQKPLNGRTKRFIPYNQTKARNGMLVAMKVLANHDSLLRRGYQDALHCFCLLPIDHDRFAVRRAL
jgi:hypothetical protein